MKIQAVDLFCGIGGLTYGLQKAGINVVAGIDNDQTCGYAYKKNNGSKFINADLTEYGGDKILKGTTFTKYKQFITNCFSLLPRQALHAKSLGFEHPKTGKWMQFDSELPEDMTTVINKWKTYIIKRD